MNKHLQVKLVLVNGAASGMGQAVARHPIGRLGWAEEVAELVSWCSSNQAFFAPGAYYPVDGGYLPN